MPALFLAIDAMATRFELILHGEDAARLRAVGEEALGAIVRLERVSSCYRGDSEIARANQEAARAPVRLSAEVFRLLEACAEVSATTGGAFDPTIGPLMKAWRFVGETGAMPTRDALAAARAAVGMKHVVLDRAGCTVRFARAGVALDLGAIGKGFAIDAAVEVLREHGVASALLHGGTSSIHAIGVPPSDVAWRVRWAAEEGLKGPRAHGPSAGPPAHGPSAGEGTAHVFALCDSALSVSASHGKSFARDGTRYGHVIDPRSGWPTQAARSALVTGPSSFLCDVLSTALLVHGETWLPEMRRRWPAYDGCVV